MKSKLSIAAMWLLAFVPLVLVAALYRLLPDQVRVPYAEVGYGEGVQPSEGQIRL